MLRGISLVTIVFLLALAPAAWSQQYENTKLLPSGGGPNYLFGNKVAICGDTTVIGSFEDDTNGLNAGSAYLFRYSTAAGRMQEETKLLPSDGDPWDFFGNSVAISGDVALIGAYADTDNGLWSGSAYVFRYDSGSGSWVEEQKLLPSDGAECDEFGASVAIYGNVALIGAYGDESYLGSAYIFRYDPGSGSWVEEDKLVASDGAANDWFGQDVALSDDTAVIGARYTNDNGNNSGSAYLFRYDPGSGSWQEEKKLLASNGEANDLFGCAVAISGGRVLIGARYADHNGHDSGSAYIFRCDPNVDAVNRRWKEVVHLVASDGAEFDYFGNSVSIYGDTALIGMWEDDVNGQNSGSAYLFRYDSQTGTWAEDIKMLASDGAAYDHFGNSVAICGDTMMIGAWEDDDNGNNSGAAYTYELAAASSSYTFSVASSTLVSGQYATFTMSNAQPGVEAYVLFSNRGPGRTWFPDLNVTIGLKKPKATLGPSLPDGSGTVIWTSKVPWRSAGKSLWFQGAQYGQATDVVEMPVE